jgi:hypothetical protein
MFKSNNLSTWLVGCFLFASLVSVAACVSVAVFWLRPLPSHRISLANANQIRKEMTLDDINMLLGSEPADFVNSLPSLVQTATIKAWRSDEVWVTVHFDGLQRAMLIIVMPMPERPLFRLFR